MAQRTVPASMRPEPDDTHLRSMQEEWHRRRTKWVESGSVNSGQDWLSFCDIERKLSDYLWRKRAAMVHADRAAHPKAKHNQPVPKKVEGDESTPGGRYLP